VPWDRAALALLDGRPDVAADILADAGDPFREARVRLLAATELVADGRGREAEAQVAKALEPYRAVGATRYVREAEALLMQVRGTIAGEPRPQSAS
jgi:hypothetical protein